MAGISTSLQSSFQKDRQLWFWFSVSAILILATLIRVWNLGAESAWIDEAYSIALAEHPIPLIIQGAAADQHPPLYYLLLHFWMQLASGVGYVRALSVLLGLVNVAQIMLFGYRLGGVYIGLVSGLLIAISPMHVWYSQEVRMYILLLVLTTTSSTSLWWALRDQRLSAWISYTSFTILALYTHYFAFFVILFQAVWVLSWFIQGKSTRNLWKWMVSMTISALCFLPWLPTAVNQAQFHTMTWIESPTLAVLRDTFLRLLFGIAVLSLPDIILWIVLFGVVAVLVWALRVSKPFDPQSVNPTFYAATWGLLPFIAISLVSLIYPIYQFKQYLITVTPFLLLYALVTKILSRSMRIVSLAIILLASSASLVYQQVDLSKDDWKGAAEYISSNAVEGDVLYGNPAAASLALEQYTLIDLPFFGVPKDYDIVSGGWNGTMLDQETTHRTFSQLSDNYQRVWLIEFFPEFWDEGETVVTWLSDNSMLIDEQWFGRIHIRLYKFE